MQLVDLAVLAEQELNVCLLSEVQINLAQRNDESEKENRIDALTRGWNRAAIMDIAAAEFNNHQSDLALTILMLDVDHYKTINDTYGHQAGDQILHQVAEKIRSIIRPMDAIGRYGGGEFLLVLTDIQNNEALETGQRICTELVNTPFLFENQKIPVTCSIGCAKLEHQNTLETLIKHADKGLYKAKEAGRNCARPSNS